MDTQRVLRKTTFGVFVANRGFFPDDLAAEGHEVIPNILTEMGYEVVVLNVEQTKHGAVETRADAKKCAALFREHADEIDGIVVTLPNFGGEDSVAETIQMAGLNVPVLIHAWPDVPSKMTILNRRDSFCGKKSVCRNLRQLGIRYSLTKNHVVDPQSEEFASEIHQFAACCRVVKGIRNCRIGEIGTRPDGFRTMRNNETALARKFGIQVVKIDLSEIIGPAEALIDDDLTVVAELKAIKGYVNCSAVPEPALIKMAKLAVVIKRFQVENDLDAVAVQCWTSLQKNYGVVPCTLMSMLSESGIPAACEVDTYGAISMRALNLASGSPAALVDWNNNGSSPDGFVAFHCSNLARSFFAACQMDFQAIIAGTVGKDSTWGTVVGKMITGPMTLFRLSDDPATGDLWCSVTEGESVQTNIDTFGGFGLIRVPKLQKLLRLGCRLGDEHHVALGLGNHAAAIYEAFVRYLDTEAYWHNAPEED